MDERLSRLIFWPDRDCLQKTMPLKPVLRLGHLTSITTQLKYYLAVHHRVLSVVFL